LGFSCALVPKANAPKHKIEGLDVVAVDRLQAALDAVKSMQR
jgi:DNA repair protein RadA/Sms